MVRITTTVAVFAALVFTAVAAEEKKAKGDAKPIGTWSRKLPNDTVVTFAIADDKMSCEVKAEGGESVTAHGKYGVTEDGTLFGVLTKVEKKGTDQGPDKGELFGFRFKIDKDTLTISDYRGSADRPQAKELIEGDYKKK
jgi:hypothetical protein